MALRAGETERERANGEKRVRGYCCHLARALIQINTTAKVGKKKKEIYMYICMCA